MRYPDIMKRGCNKSPWGYEYDEESGDRYIPINDDHLDVLKKLANYVALRAISLREAASYISIQTGRSLSHEGLRLIIKQGTHPIFTQEEGRGDDNDSREEGAEASSSVAS